MADRPTDRAPSAAATDAAAANAPPAADPAGGGRDPRRPAGDGAVGRVPPRAHPYGVEALHRLLPAAPALALAAWMGVADRWRPAHREAALARARTLLGVPQPDHPTAAGAMAATTGRRLPDEAAARRLARRQLRERRMADELFWRPWLARDLRIDGLEHLRPGRGQILAGLHVGPMALLQHALALRLRDAGDRLHVVRFRAVVDEPPPTGHRTLHAARKVARLEAAGARIVVLGDSFPVLRSLLAAGATIWMAVDVPGSGTAHLLGRPVRLATGIAALAAQTGAEVLPAHALRVRHRAVGAIASPCDPSTLPAWADAVYGRHTAQLMPEAALTVGWSHLAADRRQRPAATLDR